MFRESSRFETRRESLRFLGSAAVLTATTLLSGGGLLYGEFQAQRTKHEQNELALRKRFLNCLGLTPDSEIIYSDEYIKYPESNSHARAHKPSLRSQYCALKVANFASNTSDTAATYRARTLSQVLGGERLIIPHNIFLTSSGLTAPQAPFAVPRSFVAIGAAKGNPATRAMMGFWDLPEFPNLFLSLDRKWVANMMINQIVMPSILHGHDPLFGEWRYRECALIKDGSSAPELPTYDSRIHCTHTQTKCFFWIAKLLSPFQTESQKQAVVIISALHGRGLAAAGQMFNIPVDECARQAMQDVITFSTLSDSWQILVEVSEFTMKRDTYSGRNEYYSNNIQVVAGHRISTEPA